MSREEHLTKLVRQGQALRQEDIDLGAKQERERIIKLLEARGLWLVHLDRLTEADELRLQIAAIKGKK